MVLGLSLYGFGTSEIKPLEENQQTDEQIG